ncbi:acetyl-CoA carboxylase biotin carboxyl carrier protein subunit, partial [Streptosporangium canum]|uniref:acetyl-CoA carboxylase biotin carboxyl carrier protein subunit n=1 Tax=Streptosporangium canum TaxID=324952 RepID=UPI0037AD6E28
PTRPTTTAGAGRGPRRTTTGTPPAGGDDLISPMQGTIVKVVAADGDTVTTGDVIVVLEAMKMEQPLTAHKSGTVTGLAATAGQSVTAGAPICAIKD